jgi:hypothetical protein
MLNRTLFIALCALLVWAPLAFGSVHVWAYTLLILWCCGLSLMFLVSRFAVPGGERFEWVKTPANGPLLLLLLLVLLQAVPLPPVVLEYLSPRTFQDKEMLHSILASQAGSSGEKSLPWMPILYYLHPTVREGMKLAAYAAVFFLVLNTIRSRRRIDGLIAVLVVIGTMEVLYGIYQMLSPNPSLLWLQKGYGYARGTFTVSNHFAFFLEMVGPLTFGFAIAHTRRNRRFKAGLLKPKDFLHRIVDLFAPESPSPKKLLLFFMAVIMGLGLILSASRGGIMSIGISLMVMSGLFFLKPGFRRYGVLAIFVAVFSLIYGIYVGLQPVLNKFEIKRDYGLYSRFSNAAAVFPLIGDYPIAGVGWGNLLYLYDRYPPKDHIPGFTGVSTAGHIHNDWLEATAETGVIGGLLILAALGAILYRMIRIWLRRNDVHAVGIGAGVIAGLISVSIHSFFDFSLHMPANAVTLAAVAAVGFAALHRQGPPYKESFFYRTRTLRLTWPHRIAVLAVSLPVIAGICYLSARHFSAERYYSTEYNPTLNLNETPRLADIRKAIEINPLNAIYHYSEALFYQAARYRSPATRDRMNDMAIVSLKAAVRRNPANAYYWTNLGLCFRRKFELSDGYDAAWLTRADRCYDAAVSFRPRNTEILMKAGRYWVWRSNLFPEGNEAGMDRFQKLFRRTLAIEPERWKEAAETVATYYPEERILIGIVPAGADDVAEKLLAWVVARGAE